MPRILVCIGAVAVMSLPCRADETSPGPETLIRLSVAPAAAPTPALRYRLVPGLQEMEPGNPIQGYFRAIMAHQKFFLEEEASGRGEKLLTMPLKALAAEEVRDYGRHVLAETDRAARLERADWQILSGLKTDGFGLLLPDVQQIRALARALSVRFRAEVAEGRFDDGTRTAQTILAMARHLGEHPTVIGNLVGIAIAFTAIEPLEEMLQQPGCPNLFWALTSLPAPFIALSRGMEGERAMILTEFGALDAEAPMDSGQIKAFAERWEKRNAPGKRVQAWLDQRSKDEKFVAEARRRLVESGLPEERLLRFPAEQVLLLDGMLECLARFDDMMKTITLPIWRVEPPGRPAAKRPSALFVDDVLQHMTPGRRAQARLEQRIGLLQHVEALRLHAAEHHGALPAKLSDISVPLPHDPFTGKPFAYELRDGAAHLRGSPPPGEESNPDFNIHVQVTLQAR